MDSLDLTQDQIDLIIINVLGGVANAEEERMLQQWIAQSSANQLYYMQLCDIWESTSANSSFFDKEKAYQRFKNRVATSGAVDKPEKHFVIPPFVWWAAAVIIAFFVGGASFIGISGWNNNKLYTVTAPFGSKSKIELPDHTTVWLNAGSTLQYAQNFARSNRNVSLDGEAYFEVTKNKKMPFTVNAKELAVKVLGTKFNVRSYSEDPTVDVTLLEGAVHLTNRLTDKNSAYLLKPNEKAVLNKQSREITIAQVEALNASEWTRGKLVFDAERFGQIIRRLEREYNVTIKVADKELIDRKFYGDFRKAQSIQEIFDIMTAGNQFHYKFKESVITVYK